jgi:hypothetical protein
MAYKILVSEHLTASSNLASDIYVSVSPLLRVVALCKLVTDVVTVETAFK